MYMCPCVCMYKHICTIVCILKSEDNLKELLLSFCHVGPKIQIQVIRLSDLPSGPPLWPSTLVFGTLPLSEPEAFWLDWPADQRVSVSAIQCWGCRSTWPQSQHFPCVLQIHMATISISTVSILLGCKRFKPWSSGSSGISYL